MRLPGNLTGEQRLLIGRLLDGQQVGPRLPSISRSDTAGGRLPLSPAQRRIWFLDRLSPGSAAYNVAGVARLHGTLDAELLRRCVAMIVARHETLRTTFSEHDGDPFVTVNPPGKISLPVTDLSGLPEQQRSAAAATRCHDLAHQPFDLSADPVLRAELLRLSDAEHLLIVCIHHIAADGWSLGVLVNELSTLYARLCAGEPPDLPELPVRYADFTAWQLRQLAGPAVGGQLDYWQRRLAGAELVDLPLDRPRHLATTFAGAAVRFDLPAPLVAQLDALGQAEHATRYMVLLAAFGCLLSRWSGQRDVTVGASSAGRNMPELSGLIGCFVNTLPLRLDLTGEPTFRELLRRVRAGCLEAYERQDVPFEQVVEKLSPDRALAAQTPLFRHTLVLYDAPDPVITLPGLSIEVTPLYTSTAKFELRAELTPTRAGSIAGLIEYAAELLSQDSAQRLADSFATLLAAAAASPDAPVAALPLLSPPQRRAVVDAARRSGRAARGDACLHHLIEHAADRSPTAIAVQATDATLSYAELDERANRLARLLLARNAALAPVAVCLERSADLVVALLAVLKSGAAFVPLDPGYPAERLRDMLADCGARVLVAGPGTPPGVLSDASGLRLTLASAQDAAGMPASRPEVTVAPSDLAYIIYTSGSTGRPKGVEVTHAAVVNLLRGRTAEYGMAPGDVALSRTPIGFDVSVGEWAWPLSAGARVVLARPDGHGDPGYLAGLIASTGVTTCNVVPSLLAELLNEPAFGECVTLRAVMSGGEVLTAALAARCREVLPGAELVNLYGPTEAAIDVTTLRVPQAHDYPSGRVPIGNPIRGNSLYVLDSLMEPVPAGVTGELYIGGVQVARCYHGRPGLTAERFVPDPFAPGQRLYRTGDLVRELPGGALDFLRRSDRQVKLRGQRVEPGEIEAVLCAHDAVDRAVVIVASDSAGEMSLVGYVTVRPGVGQDEAQSLPAGLARHVRSRMPESMLPARVMILDRWPVLPNGKLDRSALPDPAPGAAAAPLLSPRTPTEEAVARIWQDVLRIERVGVLDNFFELGGHSLLAARIVARVRASYEVDLPLAALLRDPTVASVAAYLDAQRTPGGAPGAVTIPRASRRSRPAAATREEAQDR